MQKKGVKAIKSKVSINFGISSFFILTEKKYMVHAYQSQLKIVSFFVQYSRGLKVILAEHNFVSTCEGPHLIFRTVGADSRMWSKK